MLKIRKQMQIIFQDPYASLNPRMTVSEIIAEPIKVCKLMKNNIEINKRVRKMMDTVGLSNRFINTYPHELDGGRRQRIGIARALAIDPDFIVCDEPVSALDVSIQAQILNLLMDLQEEKGLTYMFITHNLSVVKHISNEIAVMYLGNCVERATSDELFENPLHPYTKALLAAIPIPNLKEREREQEIISGEVTSPIDPVPGCRFADRCPSVTDRCTGNGIPLREISEGHFVACDSVF
jgi:peptide/nickel transport system ATP-binding protein